MRRAFLFVLAVGSAISGSALAQSAPSTPAAVIEAGPYDELMTVLFAGQTVEMQTDWVLAQVRQEFVKNADITALDKQHPGLLEAMVEAARPTMRIAMADTRAQMRREWEAFIRTTMTAAEAKDAVTFYTSPLGRKMIAQANAAQSVSHTMADAVSDTGVIKNESVRKDMAATAGKVMASLTPAETAELMQVLPGKPWFEKLRVAQPKLVEIRTRVENEPLTAEQDAALEEAYKAVITRFVSGKAAAAKR